MKKLSIIFVALCLSAIGVLAACGSTVTYVANEIGYKTEGKLVKSESYGYCVKKDPVAGSKLAQILAMANTVVQEYLDNGMIEKLTAYHNAMTDDTVTNKLSDPYASPDLSANTDILLVCTEAGFAPFEYIKNTGNDSINQIAGVDIDVMMEVAKRLNMKVEINDMSFDSIVTQVAIGSQNNAYYIGAAGITIDDERKQSVSFSTPYYSSKQFIITTEANNYKNWEDLAGKAVGVQMGTTGDLMLESEIKTGVLKDKNTTVKQLAKVADLIALLKSNGIDAIVLDELPAKSVLKNM